MIEKYNYEGDPNLGFSATVTRENAVFPPDFKREEFFDTLNSATTFIAGTRLAGLFTVGNREGILVPSNIKDNEREKLEQAEVDFTVLESVETALGNLITVNNSGAIVSPKLESSVDEIEEALSVDVTVMKIAGNPNPGVASAANDTGVLLHRDADEEEAEKAREALQVEKVDIGTVNLGSPLVGSGMIVSDQQILVGENSSGPEIGRIDRTLISHD